MNNKSVLVRISDGKRFRVTWPAHWSEIVSVIEDDPDFDNVKFFESVGGEELYISAHKGHTYKLESVKAS